MGRWRGVSLATVHHYFGTKDGLYEASVEAMYEELQGHLAALDLSALPADDIDAALRALMERAFAFAREHRGALRLLMRTVIDQGELTEPLRERYQRPTLGRAAEVLSGLTGASSVQARLAIQSLIHVVLRYALSTDRELEMITGEEGDASREAIERHLVRLAVITLGPEEAS